jgi:toxin ParE1/3/4
MTDGYHIEYLPAAQADLEEIFAYILDDDPTAAAQFIDRIDSIISQLARFPLLAPVPKDPRLQYLGYRMLVVDNYLVFYVVKDQVVEIRRILHGSRRHTFLL